MKKFEYNIKRYFLKFYQCVLLWKSRKIPLSIIRKKCNAMRRGSIAIMLIEHETTKELTEK
jgi:hypothetical protein